MSERIEIKTDGGSFSAFVAAPAKLPAPAVVVLHEVFGVNRDIRQTCQELADVGFLAVAPDLFWRQEPGVELNNWSDEDWRKGFAFYNGYDRDLGVKDIAVTIAHARDLAGSSGKVGVMGFCLGGLMAFLAAARTNVDAAVAYHGGETDKYLEETSAISAPLLMHLAEDDEFIDGEAQSRIRSAVLEHPNAIIFGYPGQKHAFARHTGAHYNADAAFLAFGRTTEFLLRCLDSEHA